MGSMTDDATHANDGIWSNAPLPLEEPIEQRLRRGNLNVLAIAEFFYWGEKFPDEPGLRWAFDWFLGELLLAHHPDDQVVQAAITAYWRYACEKNLGEYGPFTKKAWCARDDGRAGERMFSQISFRYDLKDFLVALMYGKSMLSPQFSYKIKIPSKKLRSPTADQLLIAYLDAWAICGERLPLLIVEGKCPIELPKVVL